MIGGSVDPIDKAREFAEKTGATFPIAFGMDALAVSRVTGAFYDNDRKYLHATGFIVRPDKTIEVAVYSTGTVGRFVAQDVLNLIKYYKSRKKE